MILKSEKTMKKKENNKSSCTIKARNVSSIFQPYTYMELLSSRLVIYYTKPNLYVLLDNVIKKRWKKGLSVVTRQNVWSFARGIAYDAS